MGEYADILLVLKVRLSGTLFLTSCLCFRNCPFKLGHKYAQSPNKTDEKPPFAYSLQRFEAEPAKEGNVFAKMQMETQAGKQSSRG